MLSARLLLWQASAPSDLYKQASLSSRAELTRPRLCACVFTFCFTSVLSQGPPGGGRSRPQALHPSGPDLHAPARAAGAPVVHHRGSFRSHGPPGFETEATELRRRLCRGLYQSIQVSWISSLPGVVRPLRVWRRLETPKSMACGCSVSCGRGWVGAFSFILFA